jgi:hypothetical protein
MTEPKDMVVSVPNDVLDGTADKPEDPLYLHFEQLAGFMIEMNDKIAESVKDLPDEEVLRLAEICDKESEPGQDPFGQGVTKNFPSPEWARVGKRLRYEVALRRQYRAAEEYMTRTGEKVYCVHCGGACKPEHYGQL